MKGCCLFGGFLLCSECRYNEDPDDCDVKRWEEDRNYIKNSD